MSASASVWNRRAALMYTVGTWTVFGCLAFQSVRFLRGERYEKKEEEEEEEGQPQQQPPRTTTSEDIITETNVYGRPESGFYVTSTVKYKANFVPYTTRFYNYVQSFFDDSAKKEK